MPRAPQCLTLRLFTPATPHIYSEGNNYYKVEGSSVKVITKNEWQNTQPCLALFSRNGASGRGLSSFANGGSAKAGKKRRREENGNGQYSASSSGGSRARSAAAAEVIELDDDDTDGGDAKVPAGGGGRGKDAGSSCQNGSSSSVSNGGHEPSSPGVVSENGAAASGLKGGGEGKTECDGAGLERKVGRTTAPDAKGNDNEGGRSGSSSAGVPDTEPSTITGVIKRIFTRRPDEPGWLRRANTTVRKGESPAGRDGGPGPAESGGASSASRRPLPHGDLDTEARGGGSKTVGEEENKKSRTDGDGDSMHVEDDVQLVTKECRSRFFRDAGAPQESAAVSLSPPLPPRKAAAAAAASAAAASGGAPAGWLSPRHRPPGSPPIRVPERADGGVAAAAAGSTVVGGSDACLSRKEAASTEPPELPEVHDVDDEVDPQKEEEVPASKGKRHPSDVAMPFIGPARPPPAAAAGRALPPRPKPLHLRQDEQRGSSSSYSQSPWLTSRTKPRSESNQDIRRNFGGAAFPNSGGRRLGGSSGKSGLGATSRVGSGGSASGLGGGAAKGSGGQNTILSSWEKKRSSSTHGGARRGGGNSSGDEAEWKPPGKGAAASAGGGGGGWGGGRGGLRSSSRGGKVLEDLTGADEVWEDMGDLKSAGVGGGGSASSVTGGGLGDATVKTIRGINLQRDHFERIVDSDGWLTSQVSLCDVSSHACAGCV